MTNTRRLVAFLAIGLVVASILGGFFLIGTPGDQRTLRFDERRLSDLRGIVNAIDTYATRHGALPDNLGALVADPLSDVTATTDPETGAPYDYGVVDTRSYQLCADFGAASPDTTYAPDGFRHPRGHYCFTLTANGEPAGD